MTEAPAAPEATATPAAEATATPTPEVSASPSETPTPEVTETPAETTEFSDVSVDNAIANVSLSTPISEKAVFVAKQYDEDSEYFDNAIGAVINWAGQNNLALTEAVVYDLHFENEDGSGLPYGDNATVNLQFNNPILNDLEYDNVENVKTYVLHVTENEVQDVNGGIAQNGNGAVTGVTIQTNGFSPFVIVKAGSGAVMAVQEGLPSTSLADFITDVKFTDAKTDENGKLILSIESEYSFDMSFAEVPGVRQLDVENNLVLEYPTQLTPSVQSGTFDIEVIKGKNKYIVSGNTYEVINKKVVVKINKNDPNYEHLKDASNVAFNLHLKAKVSENATGEEIKFNDQVKKDVTFKSDASVSVEKTGTYDKTGRKFIYTVKVTSTGTSKKVKVTDNITGTLLKYADDVVASPDKGSIVSKTDKGFDYEIPTMKDGEVITLTYSANIDYSNLPKGAKNFTVDETKNTVSAKGENTPKSDDTSKDFNNETIATPIKKSGKAGEVKDGKQTSTWKIIVNEDANEYVGGSTVTDILKKNDKAPTDYSGKGLTVNIYDKGDHLVRTETPLWGNGVTKTESGWTYVLPEDTNKTPYRYEIIYTTVTDISSVYQDNLKIENSAEHNGESTSGEVSPISKGDTFEVTKDHENVTKDSVDWTVTVNIPDTGFNNSFTITDSLPFTWNNEVACKDSYIDGTMKVDWNGTTLVEDTHYSISPEDTGNNPIQLKLDFKNVDQLFPKVNAGTNRTLTLTYKTKPASKWPENTYHTNTVTVTGDGTDKPAIDSYMLVDQNIEKTAGEVEEIDNMPAFPFTIYLKGVNSDSLTVSDTFDKNLFEVVTREDQYNMIKPRFGGADTKWDAANAANGKSLGGTVEETLPTETGVDFKVTGIKKNANNEYYGYYALRYYLKVRNAEALKTLQKRAVDSGKLTTSISNIASWAEMSSDAAAKYKLTAVTKEQTADANSGNDYKASFKIVINPDKLKLNGGNQIDVKDVITVTEGAGAKVRLIPDSLKITLDPAGDYSTDYSEDRTTLNIKIPDECKATITYDAKVDGKGTVKYNNTVDISGGYTASSGEKTAYIESTAGGTAEVFAYTLVKRDAKTKAALNGAKFQLFDVTDNKLLTAFDAEKNRIPLVFTTNENGIVEIRHSDETVSGWSLIEGHQYRLEEIEAPDGYGIADPVTFTVVSSKANAGETIPADGIFNGEEIDVYDAKAEEVDLTATKKLTGRNLKDGEFSFKLTPDSHNPASDKNAKKTVQNTADGNISFGKLKFTEAGTYKYTVSEITGNDDTITYDNKSYTVTIVVEEGEHGALNIASKTITLNSGAKSEVKFTNAYTPKPTTAQIEAEKTVNGKAATGSQFHFTLTPKTDGDKNRSQNVTNVDGKITFAALTYDKAGVYEYEVAEVQENLPNGYTADPAVYTATVTVTDDNSGQLKASVSYKKAEESVDKPTFANTYKAEGTTAKIEAEKTVNGKAATGSQFHFTLTPKTDGDKNRSQNVTNVDGKITFAALTYDKAGVYEYEVAEVQENLPNGYTADPAVYTATVTVTDDNSGQLKASVSYKKAEESVDKPTFANTYKAEGTTAKIEAEKTVNGKAATGSQFHFTLTPKTDGDKNRSQNVTNVDGKITFAALTYDKAGVYEYEVAEVQENLPNGYTADPAVYTATVTVTDDNSGQLKASVSYKKAEESVDKPTFANTYKAEGTTAKIEAEKTVNGKAATGSQFHFTLTPKTDGDKNRSQNVTNVDGKITFAALTYDKAGVYEYEVAEVQENLPNGYTADPAVYTATVTVTDDNSGQLKASVSYKKAEESVDKPTFANTYKAEGTTAKIEAEKTVNGKAATGSQFHFTLTPKTDGDKNRSQNVTNIDGKITFAALTYDKAGVYEYEVAEVQENLPNGYMADKTVYKVTVTVTDDMSGQLKAAVSYRKGGETADKLTFANTYKASVDLQLKAQKFMKVEAEQLGTFEFELKDADGKVIETVKNDEKGAISFSKLSYTEKDAGRTFTYTVNEKIPSEADPYIYDKTVYTVTVNVEDNRDGTLKLTTKVNGKDYTATAMKFVNDSTKVTITKVNDTDRNALLGAKLQIVNAKDKVVEEWTTDGTPHVIIGKLILGETYKLVEKEAPKGYKIADPITFVMQPDGTITVNAKPVSENKLTMVDSKLHFNVNKVELGNGKEVEGAHLVVIDKETGKTVDEWVSEKDKTHDFGPKLEAGKSYILRETVAPAGYKYATDIEFTVKKDGTIETNAKTTTDTDGNKVYLVEDDTTKVTITKVDALGNLLSGVVLEIQDKDGKVINTWTTSTKDNPHVITGKLILGETYKLVEKSAPAGYTLADPVEFTVSENDIDNKVEMKNTYSASGSLKLTAKKTLTTTETPLTEGQFTFELRDKDGTVLQTKTNVANGNVTFDEIKYSLVKDNTDKKVDNTGEYQYTVNEVKGDAAGYTYDDTIYTINVTVTDAGNGTLTVTPVIHSSKATSEDATVTGMEFTNTYTTSGQIALGATKTLEGQTLEAEQFSFQATEMDADGNAVENGYNETVKNADGGAITFPIITYEKSGTHYYQITEVKDEKPAYQYDESKYVVKVDVTDDNAGKLTAKVTSVTKNGEPVKSEDLTGAVTFTNTYSASADLELKAQKSMKVEG